MEKEREKNVTSVGGNMFSNNCYFSVIAFWFLADRG